MLKITALASIALVSFALTGCAASTDDENDGTEGSSALERGRAAGDTSAAADRDNPETRRDNDLPNLRRYHAARIQAARRAAAAADDDGRDRTPDRGEDRGDDRTPDRDGDRPAVVTRRNADDTRR